MNNLVYLIYNIYKILVVFIVYLIVNIYKNQFLNLFFLIFLIILYTFYSYTFKNQFRFFQYNYFNTIKKDNTFSLIFLIKQLTLLLVIYLLFYFNLVDVIFITLTLDFVIKITMDKSILEFYFNRKIRIKGEQNDIL